MDFLQKHRSESSAYVQLLILTGYALAGLIICSILSLIVLLVFSDHQTIAVLTNLSIEDPNSINSLKIVQILSSIGLFLLPPIFLAVTEGSKISQFYNWQKPTLAMLGIIFLLMMVSLPITELSGLINQKMTLPEALKPLENWMRDKEEEASKMVVALLKMDTAGDFLLNLFMIAFLPAVAEELMFRGGVQRAFSRMFGNPHVAIWITAFIFSAIHVQFFGFIPRLLLGALFGYLYVWTKSLWYPMFAHFLNNAYAVCMALYFQIHNLPLENVDEQPAFNWMGYVLGLVLTVLLLIYLRKRYIENGKQLDQSIHHHEPHYSGDH
ncbi:lysostaphin resistance A-like protein [Pedobacter sp. SAFR-022]|uniref:CPBP family intramembrane glutamic endopeptidase n=1 Tax=Pedobacter sp. SAFR-022 TaxID=3436861 RepID=UPI003F815F49